MTLDEIAIKHGTDKSSKGHNYCNFYELFFEPLRYDALNLLEIGVDKGASLLTWAEYFAYANIVGIDLRGDYEYLHTKRRIKTHILDQSSDADLALFGIQHEDEFTVIIDDGSHQADHQILTFETLFLYLKPGGYYCIEDCLCSVDGRWNRNANVYDRIKQMIDEVNFGYKLSTDFICADRGKQISKIPNLTYYEKHIEWVFNSPGLVIVKKKL